MDKDLADAYKTASRLLRSGKQRELIAFVEGAIARFPNDAELRMTYATGLWLESRWEDAQWQVATAVSLNIDDPGLLARAARFMLDVGDPSTAARYADWAARLAPPDFEFEADLENVRGVVAALNGDSTTAEAALRAACQQRPEQWTFSHNLARFLYNAGRKTEAFEIIDAAIASGPSADLAKQLRQELTDQPRA